jgi:hypothetical protein
MSIHPQFFDSVDEFVAHRVTQWEQENPHPVSNIPAMPDKPESQFVPLQQGNGFIVVECRDTADITITIQKRQNPVTVSIQQPALDELIEALMYVLAESEELHKWRSQYKPLAAEHNRKVTYWKQEREKVVQECIAAYEALQSPENAKNGQNSVKAVTYSVIRRKSYDGKPCYAVCASYPHYMDGQPIEVGGMERWVFWTPEEAYQDAERRARLDVQQGKVVSVQYNANFGANSHE